MRLAWLALCALSALVATAAPAPPKLAIVRAMLHEGREDGPAVRANYEYIAGELMYLSFRVSGYTVAKDAVDLRWQTYITDPEGTMIAPMENGAVKDEVTGNDKDWLPLVQQSIALSPHLPGGEFTIHLRLADENAKTTTEQTLTFHVRGRAIEKVDTLTVRNLRFYRTEDDTVALAPALYAPGDALWLRCEVVGFTLDKDNAYDVAYSFAIYGGDDKLLYEQKEAGTDQGKPFYPKRRLTGIFSVSLTKDLAPGDYRIVVKAVDKATAKSAEQGDVFTVKK